MNNIVNLQYNLNFQKSNRVSKNSLKDLSVSLRYSINRYDTALYNLLLFQTGRQDLVTFFSLCFTINGTNSFEYVLPAQKKTKGREKKREGKGNMQTERRDTAEKTIEFDALLKRLSRPLWIRFCGLRETEKLWGRFHRRRADIVSIKQIPWYQRKGERQREKKKEKGSGKRVLLGWRELVKGNAKERERRREERSPRAYSGTKSGWVSEICIDLPVWRIFQRNQPSRENIYEKHDRRSLIFPDLGWI